VRVTTAKRAYGGIPATERQADRRARLIEASLDIVGADGPRALTVTRLCRSAGLNERYFNESFTDVPAVLVAASDLVAQTIADRILTALAAAEEQPRARATAAIGAAVDVLADDPRMGVLFLQSAAVEELAARRTELAHTFVELLKSQALAALRIQTTPEVDSWATFVATHLFGGVLETIGAWIRGDLELTREQLVERNVDLFLAVGAGLGLPQASA
jgi:AcrR family transcriptional regulator